MRTARWLLAVPLLALAWPPLYNREEPRLVGIPFFYAYQLLMIPLAACWMAIAVRQSQRRHRPARRDQPPPPPG